MALGLDECVYAELCDPLKVLFGVLERARG